MDKLLELEYKKTIRLSREELFSENTRPKLEVYLLKSALKGRDTKSH
jgi:hypothetical protein